MQSIIMLIRQQHDNMALDMLRDVQEKMGFEHLMILLEELKCPYAGEVPCIRTYKAVLSHILRSHSARTVQNPSLFADVRSAYYIYIDELGLIDVLVLMRHAGNC